MTPQGLPEVFIKHRADNDPSGPTFGDLTAPGGFACDSMERPQLGDHPCIGKGAWRVHAFQHPEHGLCYELQNVVMADGTVRTAILIHSANWIRQLLGCIALGRATMVVEGIWQGQPVKEMGISSSKDAVAAFWTHMEGKDFMLTIS